MPSCCQERASSFVHSTALSNKHQSARMSKITNDDNPVWHRILYSCSPMATVGVKGLRMCPQLHLCAVNVGASTRSREAVSAAVIVSSVDSNY